MILTTVVFKTTLSGNSVSHYDLWGDFTEVVRYVQVYIDSEIGPRDIQQWNST